MALFEGGPKKAVDPNGLNATVLLKDPSEAGFADLARQVSMLVLPHSTAENYPSFLKYASIAGQAYC